MKKVTTLVWLPEGMEPTRRRPQSFLTVRHPGNEYVNRVFAFIERLSNNQPKLLHSHKIYVTRCPVFHANEIQDKITQLFYS